MQGRWCRHLPQGRNLSIQQGFTLVELVTVIIVTGILSAVVLPRMLDKTFDERGFHDAAKAAVQHARHVALASRRYVCVNVTAGTGGTGSPNVALRIDTTDYESVITVSCTTSSGGAAVALPAPGRGCSATNQVCPPTGVTLGGGSLIFNALGQPVNASGDVQATDSSITVSHQSAISITHETGYVQ